MQPRNNDAPGVQPRGAKNTHAAGKKSTTKRYRLPSNWRDRLPDPATVYRAKLKDLSPPDRDGWATARCPFHDGLEQSLSVDMASRRGGWRCATCGAHGDLVGFTRQAEGLSFPAAVHALIAVARRPTPSANAEDHIQRCRALLAEVAP